jgi:hypothetical protein
LHSSRLYGERARGGGDATAAGGSSKVPVVASIAVSGYRGAVPVIASAAVSDDRGAVPVIASAAVSDDRGAVPVIASAAVSDDRGAVPVVASAGFNFVVAISSREWVSNRKLVPKKTAAVTAATTPCETRERTAPNDEAA